MNEFNIGDIISVTFTFSGNQAIGVVIDDDNFMITSYTKVLKPDYVVKGLSDREPLYGCNIRNIQLVSRSIRQEVRQEDPFSRNLDPYL
jgi:hypothetical protein